MRPLPIDKNGEVPEGPGSNATQFFAIPKARRAPKRSTETANQRPSAPAPQAAPAPVHAQGHASLPPSSMPPQSVPPSAMPSSGPYQHAPRMGASPGLVPAGTLPPNTYAPNGYPNGAGALAPYHAQMQPPPVPMKPKARTYSYRGVVLVALFFGITAVAAMVGVSAIAAITIFGKQGPAEVVVTNGEGNSVIVSKPDDDDDEGAAWLQFLKEETVIEKPRERIGTRSTGPGSESDMGPQAGPITVSISGSVKAPQLVVSCDNGYRTTINLSGGRGSASNIEPDTKCRLSLKGGEVAAYPGATANRTYRCSVRPPQLVCN